MERKVISRENALIRLETLCARSERCTYELLTKLRGWGITGSVAEEIIDDLVDRRFVDDERFARSFVKEKFRFSHHGRLKIRAAMMLKRIPDRVIRDAMAEIIDEDEYRETLSRVLRTKAERLEDLDTFGGRTKLFRFGASRGFEPSLVGEVMKAVLKQMREEAEDVDGED